jgi:hypothetical protein
LRRSSATRAGLRRKGAKILFESAGNPLKWLDSKK